MRARVELTENTRASQPGGPRGSLLSPAMKRKRKEAHSSGLSGVNSTALSSYTLRQAGQLPLRFCLMWCQQKRQICPRVNGKIFSQAETIKSQDTVEFMSGPHLITARTGLEVQV